MPTLSAPTSCLAFICCKSEFRGLVDEHNKKGDRIAAPLKENSSDLATELSARRRDSEPTMEGAEYLELANNVQRLYGLANDMKNVN